MSLAFDYSVNTVPSLINEMGKGNGAIKGLTIFAKADPGVFDGKFQIDFEYIEIDIEDFDLELTGGDISVALNYFSDYIKQVIKESLVGVLQN
jgi:hypothetical protein